MKKKLITAMVLAAVGALTPATADTWTVSYPAGAKAAEIDIVQLKCTDGLYRYLADDATIDVILDGTVVRTLVRDDITLNLKKTYTIVDLDFNPALTTPGVYTLSVPDALFSTVNGDISEGFTIDVTVTAPAYTSADWAFTCADPAGGSADSLETILLESSREVSKVLSTAAAQLYNSSFEAVAEMDASSLKAVDGALQVTLPQPVTAAGTYMLVINANSVANTAAGVTNNETSVELTVNGAEPEPEPGYDITAMPASGSCVAESTGIQAVYVSIAGYSFKSANTEGIVMTVTKDGAPFATVDADALSAAMDQATMCISLPEAARLKTVGQYSLVMPAGYFTMKSAATGDILPSPAIVLSYTITAPAVALSWTASPAPGTVSQIDRIDLTFNKQVKIALTTDIPLFRTGASYISETVTEGHLSLSDDGLTATIAYSPVFAWGGIYQVRLYEGDEQLSVVDGEAFPGVELTYKVDAPLYTECIPAASEPQESLQQVKVKLPYNNIVKTAAAFEAWFTNGSRREEASLVKVASYDFGDPAYVTVTTAAPITATGKWTLVIAAGSLELGNYGETMASPEVKIDFSVGSDSLLDTLEAAGADTPAEVYTLTGVRIPAAAVPTLPAGLYLVNGRKTAVR